MPTLLNKNGFKFFFYANEHEPKHIHVAKDSGFAKVELDNLTVVQNYLYQIQLTNHTLNEHKVLECKAKVRRSY